MKHYYCGSCIKHFDFNDKWLVKNCPLCDKPVKDITRDRQKFLQEAQDFAAQQAVKAAPNLPTQMRGLNGLYSSEFPSWTYIAPAAYGCTVKINPNPLSQTVRLEFSETYYMTPFVDMTRKDILSLAAYLVDYLERTQEKV